MGSAHVVLRRDQAMDVRHSLAFARAVAGAALASVALHASPASAEEPQVVASDPTVVLDMSVSFDHSCVITVDGTIHCWQSGETTMEEPPAGAFSALSVGSDACALDGSGAVTCWGEGLESPDGRFTSISVGRERACGVRLDGTISCWSRGGDVEEHDGSFVTVSVGLATVCAIESDAHLECWPAADDSDGLPAIPGTFESVDVGDERACAIRTGGELVWWTADGGQEPSPDGTFTAVSGPCAIRTD